MISNLRKIASSIRLGKDDDQLEPHLVVHQGISNVRKSPAKLRKRVSKTSSSGLDLNVSEEALPDDASKPSKASARSSRWHRRKDGDTVEKRGRQNSAVLWESVADFGVAAHHPVVRLPLRHATATAAASQSATGGSMLSGLGIKHLEQTATGRTPFSVNAVREQQTNAASSGASGISRHGRPTFEPSTAVRPSHTLQADVSDERHSISAAETTPSVDAEGCRESWETNVRVAAKLRSETSAEASTSQAPPLGTESGKMLSYPMSRMPADSSPADSGVALVSQDQPAYSGKGKGRAAESESYINHCSAAIRQYLCTNTGGLEEESGDSSLHSEEDDRRLAEKLQQQLCGLQEEHDRLQAEKLHAQHEEDRRLAAERARFRDCAVCGDTKDPLNYPATAATAKCLHPPQTCTECLQSWMASEFETKGVDGILCPECPIVLEYADMQRAASAETFEAFDRISTTNALSSLPDFAWCLGPNCKSGQLNIENDNYMDCASCGYKQCLKHKTAWHSHETCEQYEYRTSGQKARDEERATEAMLDDISKKCPGRNCNWRIQKIDGCDHMTCRKCRHEFCWQCLASQKQIKKEGNTAHQTWCKFHSNNLDVAWPFNAH